MVKPRKFFLHFTQFFIIITFVVLKYKYVKKYKIFYVGQTCACCPCQHAIFLSYSGWCAWQYDIIIAFWLCSSLTRSPTYGLCEVVNTMFYLLIINVIHFRGKIIRFLPSKFPTHAFGLGASWFMPNDLARC